jgi:hypothetical protein
MKLNIEGHEIELLFTCDPEKNTECKKTVCQVECFHTKEIQFAKNPGKAPFKQFYVKNGTWIM